MYGEKTVSLKNLDYYWGSALLIAGLVLVF